MDKDDTEILDSFLKDQKKNHYNFEKEVNYKVSSGSLQLDLNLDGGFGPGLHRFVGIMESGKTSCSLEVMKNMLDTVPESKGFYIKAEGRLSDQMKKRSGINFVFEAKDWKEGTCFVLESNIYEVVVDIIHKLVEENEEEHKYCFILDSVDGLISQQDLDKSFYDSNKVAGGAVIAANFMKRMSIKLAKRGHMAIFISQVRADIKLDPYSKEPVRQTSATGGNALLHFANYILEFQPRFNADWILQNPQLKKPDPKKNPIVGHWAKATIKKSPNEKTNLTIAYPIRYGRTGGKSVWLEKEIVDMLYIWEFIQRKGSWVVFNDEFVELIQPYVEDPSIDRVQGDMKLFKYIEDNPKLSEFLISYFKENIAAFA